MKPANFLILEVDPEILPLVGVSILDVCVTVGFAKTRTEARRLIRQGGIRLDDVVIDDETARLAKKDGEFLILVKRD